MDPSRALAALVLVCGVSAASALTVRLDAGPGADARKAAQAEAEIRRLVGPAAERRSERGVLSYRAAAWSPELDAAQRRVLVEGLRAAWGARFSVDEADGAGAAAGAPARPAPSAEKAGQKALAVLAPDALAGRHGKAYDGSAERDDAVAAPGAAAGAAAASGLTKPARTAATLPVFDPSAMDAATDPCADFYRYSCGTWLKNNPVPPDRSTWMRFSSLDEQTLGVLREILEEAASKADAARKSEDEKKIGALYSACMDQTAAETRGAAPLKAELARIGALSGKKALAGEVARLHLRGASPLFGFGSSQDYQRAERVIAAADQAGLSLPDRDYYLKDEFAAERSSFAEHVAKMFVLLGDAPGRAAEEAAWVTAVETGLAKASADTVSRREPAAIHHKEALARFERASPAFDWAAYLKAIGAPKIRDVDDMSPGFFKGMSALIAATGLDGWKSYLRWQLLHQEAGQLSSAFVNEDFRYFGMALNGQKELRPRWKRCVGLVDGKIGDALGKAYVAREFGADKKALALAMVRDIEKSMGDDIRALAWMTPGTRAKALGKLAKVANKIGYPDQWRDYSRLTVDGGDLAGDVARANAFEFRRQLAKIGKPVDRGEWGMTAPTDNDYYDSQLNDINFPAGSLQPPLFDANAPAAANYGATGAVMGHELTHAFDDEGRRYDAGGNLKDWWTPADSAAFEARTKGFVDQYSGYKAVREPGHPERDVPVNGKLTLGENLADDGGLRLAYAAYKRRSGPDGAMGGFSGDQLFFLSYGQSWCGNQTPESARVQAASDPHSPPEFRVNGVLSNNPDFARAFSCREGSPMRLAKPNRVW